MAYRHYVPKLHIRNFGINKKQTARFDKTTNRPPIPVPITSFCGEEDYFAFDESSLDNLPHYLQWIHKDLIENNLSQCIEGPISSILKTLIKERSLGSLSEKEILMLLEWLAWIFIANPRSLAIDSILCIADQFKNINYSELSRTDRLKVFVDLHELITPVFQKRKWLLQLVDPSHGYLLSSDRPVMIGGKALTESPDLSNQTVFFPMSPHLLLIGDNSSEWGYASVPLQSTREATLLANILSYDQSHRFIFGADIKHFDAFFKSLNDNISGEI